jgi:hypothetical protein
VAAVPNVTVPKRKARTVVPVPSCWPIRVPLHRLRAQFTARLRDCSGTLIALFEIMGDVDRERLNPYVWSVPERLLRAISALAGGALRETGEVVLPNRVRRTRLYQSLIDSTLRFMIEQVGRVEGAYSDDQGELPKDFLLRRTAGNALEIAGIVAFRASPVWVLAVLADISGAGRELISEIADALKKDGLLEPGRNFDNVDQLLDGFERTAGQLAETVNTPPLDVASLREEWAKLRAEAHRIPLTNLPSPVSLWNEWRELKQESAAQGRSISEFSSAMAISAVRKLPTNARWLSRAIGTSARRSGDVFGRGLLEHYRSTLAEIRETGYVRYWIREFKPYLSGALQQFSPQQPSTTERFLEWRHGRRHPPGR